MLNPKPALRISAEDALKHAFFDEAKGVIADLLKVNDLITKGH
jgi:hypothetical protein